MIMKEKHSCLFWEYKWDLTVDNAASPLIQSKFVEINRLQAFCLGFKRADENRLASVYCCANNFALRNARLDRVTCTFKSAKVFELKGNDNLKSVEGLELLEAKIPRVDIGSSNWELGANCFTFQFYLSALDTEEGYVIRRFDALLPQQLWEAATHGQFTDIGYTVDERPFPAHKAVIDSRCPGLTDSPQCGNNAVVFEQFLRFLYTGQLPQSVDFEFDNLADSYQVRHLANLDPTQPSESQPEKQMRCTHPSLMQTGVALTYEADYLPGKVDKWSLDFNNKTIFVLKMESTSIKAGTNENNQQPEAGTTTLVLQHRTRQGKDSSLTVSGVSYCITKKAGCFDNFVVTHKMALSPATGIDSNQMFAATIEDKNKEHQRCNLKIRFVIHLVSTVQNFSYQLSDYFRQLFDCSINNDIHFQLGQRSYPAHPGVVAARSPVLASIMAQQLKASPNSRTVTIENVHPTVFDELLHFIHTGTLLNDAEMVSGELRRAAEFFQVDTLKRLGADGAPPAEHHRMDLDQLSTLMMSM